MPPAPSPDLFALQDGDPVRDWSVLTKELESFQPSLLRLWKDQYAAWKHNYQRFRDAEQKTLFTQDEAGEMPQPSEQVFRWHRRALLALFHSGELCADQLASLNLEGEDAQERLDWTRRIRTLLDSLQETLELWHPVNMERIEEKKAIFAR
jgi:hypothetical protein